MIRSLPVLLLLGSVAHGGVAFAAAPPDVATLAAAPRHRVPATLVDQALVAAEPSERPYRFAAPVALDLTLAHGQWDPLDAETARWRLRLASPGAQTISVHLAPLTLPPAARLWIYPPSGEPLHGPYTAADVSRLGFWTPVLAGDELVLEFRAPRAAIGSMQAQVARLFHGYRGFPSARPQAVGDSDHCNINVACSQGAAWDVEARSVAMITIGNEFLCTGQLLNNVRQDRRPLFLTADHCGIDGRGGPAESVNFYFNYQAANCNAPPLANPEGAIIGSTFLADDVQSDFTLVRIKGSLPPNVYFAGWNATGQASSSGASIHHPQGDEKKISLYNTTVTPSGANIGTGCEIDAWQVQWSEGTTEPGSSGGGLWNSNHQLIGVLSGGTASCANPTGFDYFGRIDRAWTANASVDGQLKAHLDPQGTCIASIPGLDPAATPTPAPITNGPTRCEGEFSDCGGIERRSGGGGGAPAPWLLAGLAFALVARRR